MSKTFLQISLALFVAFNSSFRGVKCQTVTPFFSDASWDINTLTTSQAQKLSLLLLSPDSLIVSHVEVGDLAASQQNGRLIVNIPGTSCTSVFVAKHVESDPSGNYYWYGEFFKAGDVSEEECQCNTGSMNLMRVDDEIFGNILIDEIVYSLHDLGGGKRVLARKKNIDSVGLCGNIGLEENMGEIISSLDRSEGSCPVKLLALYTDSARESVPNIHNIINLVVKQTNQAFRNSDVQSHELNVILVGIQAISFDESNEMALDRDDIIADPAIQALRDSYNADIVTVFVESDYGDVFGQSGTLSLESERAYSLVRATKTDYFVGSHEIGHLFGCRHQLVSDDFGPIEHAHQFVIGCWPYRDKKRTLMWSRASGSLVQHFSNPNVEYHIHGSTTGSTDANNAQNLKNTACIVANFRSEDNVPTLHVGISGSSNACPCTNAVLIANIFGGFPGVPTISWRTSLDGFNWSPVQGTQSSFQVNAPCTEGFRIYVQLTVTSPDGQTDVAFFSVLSTLTWSGQTMPCQERNAGAGISPGDDNFELKAFPCPANTYVSILGFLSDSGKQELMVCDLFGKVMKIVDFYADMGELNCQMDISTLPKGHYVVSLRNRNKISHVRILKTN